MKIVFQILFGLVIIVSCSDKKDERAIETKVVTDKNQNRDSLISLQNFHDSIRLVNFREDAFSLAGKPISDRINTRISENGKVVIFQNIESFLYLRFNVNSWKQKIEFYKIRDKKTNLMWEEMWEDMTFRGDTIRDLNGDNHFDILTNFYPLSGCCRRNSFWIRLFDSEIRNFSDKIRMINPTFYPEEKIVRGIGYGHSGEVPIYKMKWSGNKLDTVEYIYPFPEKKGKFLITNKFEIYPERKKPPKGQIIYSLPEEYKNIESIEWFLDY